MNSRDVWVIAETAGSAVAEVTLENLADAREFATRTGGKVRAIVFGEAGEAALSPLASHGADEVVVALGEENLAHLHQRCVEILSALIDEAPPRAIVFAGSGRGNDIATRLAVRRRLAIATGVNSFAPCNEGIEAARPVYSGKLYQKLHLATLPGLITVQPGVAGMRAPQKGRSAFVARREFGPACSRRVEFLDSVKADPKTMDIAEADRIVAIGRGIGSSAAIAAFERLAELLGAALAASRPVVDTGWVPFERQVGQTGKVVTPSLYVACGISGASHHTLGMKNSKCIIAINSDKDANIFKLADLKVAADLRGVVPALVRKLEDVAGN